METQITINWTSIIFGVFSVIISVLGFLLLRIIKGYDSQIKELFERTKDLAAIKEAIDWIKKEIQWIKEEISKKS
ncbi:MAG: hypothetical protein ACFFC1_06250 [Promethearchaeota archaeon]